MKQTIRNIKMGWVLDTGDLGEVSIDSRKYEVIPQEPGVVFEGAPELDGAELCDKFKNIIKAGLSVQDTFRVMKYTAYVYDIIKDRTSIGVSEYFAMASILKQEILSIPDSPITESLFDSVVDDIYLSYRFSGE